MPFQTYCYYIPPMEYMHKHKARRCILLSAAPDTVQVPVPLADVQASVLPATSTFHNGTSLVFDPFKAFHSTISTHRNTTEVPHGHVISYSSVFPHRNQDQHIQHHISPCISPGNIQQPPSMSTRPILVTPRSGNNPQ
ncbi:hypothetical protein J3E68DRAFT_398297 [Trichoderma sp. SZMC 28012]